MTSAVLTEGTRNDEGCYDGSSVVAHGVLSSFSFPYSEVANQHVGFSPGGQEIS